MKSTRYDLGSLRISLFALIIAALGFGLTALQIGVVSGSAQTREIRVLTGDAVAGQTVNIPVQLASLGTENAVGFSLNFNPAIFSNPIATPGSDLPQGAQFNVNSDVTNGRVGIALALSTGQTFTTGTRQIAVVTLSVAANAPVGLTPISFGNQPVNGEISDASANSLAVTFTGGSINVVQPNPTPTLTALTPSSATAGAPGFTMTVTGSNFINSSVVRWKGSPRNTTYVSPTQLLAIILTDDLAVAGTAQVSVLNPAPGGGISSSIPFTVNNPTPTITTVAPDSTLVGGPDVAIAVTGTGFNSSSKVRLNGADLTTTFVSATQLGATIPASALTTASVANITVFNPTPGGGASNVAQFTINNPVPTIASLNPTSVLAGGPGFTLTVNGANFVNGSVIRINGAAHATSFVSGTQLTTAFTAAEIASQATLAITVFNPTPGGGTSNAVNFTINNPAPTITSLSPTSKIAGSPGFSLTINGTGFTQGSTAQWNGANRTTTLVSATQLTATILAGDVAAVGAGSVTVVNAAPGGGTSNAVSFMITQPPAVPTITSLNPTFAIAGNPQFMLTVNGTNFANNSVVRWNDSDRATTFVGPTQLIATIPATDIASPGTANVKVFTPAPGGGTSNTAPFFIGAQLFTSVSAASYKSNELADASIIAGFGTNLATQTQIANAQPLPTTLAGSKIVVRDSAGVERMAPLFFVSPLQANYQTPPGTADGLATIVATSGDNKISVGTMQITRVAPGVFSANSDGGGVAAALVLRVKADNSQTFESIVRFDAGSNKFVSNPVDMGPDTDQLFLVLYGTGFRFRTALSAVGVTIGGEVAQITFADPAPGFTGLDQVNARIPRNLIGRGEVDVVLTVNGKVANTVRLNIK